MKILGYIRQVPKDETKSAYYIYPQYEVNYKDQLQEILSPKQVFPNYGTIFYTQSNGVIENYRDKYICINFNEYETAPKYDPNIENSCKYAVGDFSIEAIKSDQIIEIIKIDRDFEQMVNVEECRFIKIDHKPLNSKLFIEIDEFIYGPFECIDKSENDDVRKIRLVASTTGTKHSYSIFKYKKSKVNQYIRPANVNSHNAHMENRKFIYSLKELSQINEYEEVDFIENTNLINIFTNILKNEKEININRAEITKIKNAVEYFKKTDLDFKDQRIKRLANIIDLSSNLIDYKSTILDEYFKSEKGNKLKVLYLQEHQEILDEIIKKTEDYNRRKSSIEKELGDLENKKIKLQEEIIDIEKNKKTLEEKAIQKKAREYDEIANQINIKEIELNELMKKLKLAGDINQLQDEKKRLEEENFRFEIYNNDLAATKSALKSEVYKFNDELETKLKEIATSRINNEVINILNYEKDIRIKEPDYSDMNKTILEENISVEELVERVSKFFEEANRKVTREDIINYLISVTQNFITVFAGEPGVGKTSLCSILCKSLGLYNNRFNHISVERGWTSPKDLIGYYNPLTKSIEKSNTGLYNSLSKVNTEHKNNINNIPYVVLLDEANLSPIEHYWSRFMSISDISTKQKILINEDNEFYLTEGFKFLATINYDHTTESLSPRFLDRAWVIHIDHPSFGSILEHTDLEDELKDYEKIISFDLLKKYFTASENEELDTSMTDVLKTMNDILTNTNESKLWISARSARAIKNYCIVAQKYMKNENPFLAIDYAISQKVLPLINGYGQNYKLMLEELKNFSKRNSLIKTATHIEKIINIGDQEHGYYQFFGS